MRALHWAAWMGASATVDLLIHRGAQIEAKDSEFGGTPLFWAVHGYGPDGAAQKRDQVGAAKRLIDAGADPRTADKRGVTARAERAVLRRTPSWSSKPGMPEAWRLERGGDGSDVRTEC
jgi:ankyrin repeat protein